MKPAPRSDAGFVLLVVLSALAVVVLMVVSLATLTRVETATAFNQEQEARARQAALMALRIGIGRLQESAGRDDRVTATAEAFGGAGGTRYYTGVWDSASVDAVPITWLVGGNEVDPRQVTPASDPTNFLELVGVGTAAGSEQVRVPVQTVMAGDQPGRSDASTFCRYTWWVGDEGVKAAVGWPDRRDAVTYGHWSHEAQRRRLRQQLAGPAVWIEPNEAGYVGFEPFEPANDAALTRVLQAAQLQWLQPVDSAALAGALRQRYFDLTAASQAVLSSTVPADSGGVGLLGDLSLAPEQLGPAFAAYSSLDYVEAPALGNSALPAITSAASPRRRVALRAPVMQPTTPARPAFVFSVAPVLTDFLLQFRVDRVGSEVEVRSRVYVALWNPYTSALVPPPDLQLEVTGLPIITITDPIDGGTVEVDLGEAPFGPWGRQVYVPFVEEASQTDRASWLPGRIYGWVTAAGSDPPAELTFYSKTLNAGGWRVRTVPLAGTSNNLSVDAPPAGALTVQLSVGGVPLATCRAPPYPLLRILDVEPVGQGTSWNWRFAYAFRLNQPTGTSLDRSWLLGHGRDPRAVEVPAATYDPFHPAAGFNPAATPYYAGIPPTATGLEQHLLFRVQGSALTTRSANYDTPVFELPRQPLLSLGELQHLHVAGGRPFSVGNSWGGAVNTIFDRYYFSGLTGVGPGPDLAAGEPLPNAGLTPVESRRTPSAPLTLDVLRGEEGGWGARSSRFLLQEGAFNVNSVRPAAWRALLLGGRHPVVPPMELADIDNGPLVLPATGSQRSEHAVVAAPLLDGAWGPGGRPGPLFWRFPQTAQETYVCSAIPELGPNELSRRPFRQGVRGGDASPLSGLTAEQVGALAVAISERVGQKQTASGPFRSLQEFLGPHAMFGGLSVIERAIHDTRLNDPAVQPVAEVTDESHVGYSSLSLTQADILTALAPYLRCRSDTFLVRGYAETVNPATDRVAARAWCEAVVQRMPRPVDPNDSIDQPAGPWGRRFEMVSFRWLRPDDI